MRSKRVRVGVNWAENINKLVTGKNAVRVKVELDNQSIAYLAGLGVGLIALNKLF